MKKKKIMITAMIQGEEVEEEMMMTMTTKCMKIKITSENRRNTVANMMKKPVEEKNNPLGDKTLKEESEKKNKN
jgi:hypothetical protein